MLEVGDKGSVRAWGTDYPARVIAIDRSVAVISVETPQCKDYRGRYDRASGLHLNGLRDMESFNSHTAYFNRESK